MKKKILKTRELNYIIILWSHDRLFEYVFLFVTEGLLTCNTFITTQYSILAALNLIQNKKILAFIVLFTVILIYNVKFQQKQKCC